MSVWLQGMMSLLLTPQLHNCPGLLEKYIEGDPQMLKYYNTQLSRGRSFQNVWGKGKKCPTHSTFPSFKFQFMFHALKTCSRTFVLPLTISASRSSTCPRICRALTIKAINWSRKDIKLPINTI